MTSKELRKLDAANQTKYAVSMMSLGKDPRDIANVLGWSVNKVVRTFERTVPLKKGRKRRDKATGKTVIDDADPTQTKGKI